MSVSNKQKLKLLLTNTLFKVISVINLLIPKNDSEILMYSNMGFRDNVAYLYEYLIKNGYNKKYKIIRSHNEDYNVNLPQNVKIISNAKAVLCYLRAGHVFYCFGKIPIYPSKSQIVIQMWHGTPFKGADEWQKKTVSRKSFYTYLLMSSHYFDDIAKKYYGVKDENIAICGQPRTDVMFQDNPKYDKIVKYRKIIIWMPTFRASTALGYSNTSDQEHIIPIFKSDDFVELNEYLKRENICLLVKLHPMQDIGGFNSLNLSNLYLLSHKEFVDNGWDLYRLIGQCDAMVTDYSSVFYDFMLLDRPLGFTVDDIIDYKESRGFAVKDPEYLTAGYKLKDKASFFAFIDDVSQGVDKYEDHRREVNKMINVYNDGKQCERVLKLSHISINNREENL